MTVATIVETAETKKVASENSGEVVKVWNRTEKALYFNVRRTAGYLHVEVRTKP